jgi:predicted DNA-binding transcriptional regulator AlpA
MASYTVVHAQPLKAGMVMDKDAYDVIEFCHRHAISRSAFYNSLKNGTGPRIMRLGTRVLVSKEAAEQWRRDRERATSEQPTAA